MVKTDLTIMPGNKVMVFDNRLYENDKDTPLSMTTKEATVLCRYGTRSTYNREWIYPDLVDVIFDYDNHVSKGHFTYGVDKISEG